ncbi:leucine-rich repeat domain-containing protein [Flavobacterium tegetincola]|uniref:leucine-rich repeat domain-containing protein n=1 Tax=Flavobacterium tegetincola TaxID=150172 RepID=UPI0009FD0B54|nr:leucine-rich repeat domain-containing protein [Flavobacterium tegetincola]
MRTKLLLFSVMICIFSTTNGQTKKSPNNKIPKAKTHIPVVKQEKYPEPPRVEVLLANPGDGNVTMSAPPMVEAPKQISLYLINGEMITARKVSELDNIDFKKIKKFKSDNRYTPEFEEVAFNAFLEKLLNDSPNLEELDLQNCKIKIIPKIVNLNTNLKAIDLSYNNLTELPESLALFPNLEKLILDTNQLSGLPQSIIKLKKLNCISLDKNHFTKFPEELFSIPTLETLTLYKNNLKTLPDQFNLLPNLTTLDLQYTNISSLPPSIATLSKLNSIGLNGNQFAEFPASAAALKTLKQVDFSNNPIDIKIFMQSLDAIKWRGLFSLYDLKLTKVEYEAVQEKLKMIDVYH